MIEPIDRFEERKLDLFQDPPRCIRVGGLGLEQAVDHLSQGVFVEIVGGNCVSQRRKIVVDIAEVCLNFSTARARRPSIAQRTHALEFAWHPPAIFDLIALRRAERVNRC